MLERARQRSWRIKWIGIDAPTGHGSRHLRPHGTPLNEHFQKKRKEKTKKKTQANSASDDAPADSRTMDMEDIPVVHNVAFDPAEQASSENPGNDLLSPHGRN